ncbi:regulating synaptic membrane exocytosis protein 2-like isoform X2 [Limulus polyphemus]|uniref:Regulating synaptic membrane exocytosis protein 2-like isoform X2 n=1 Tax=Limulus polyphemus TaxID=6850 RepID=A0ABM1SHZ4_LIMPO|nr:regulating synaptic membrane exocytosis protein 2-like isoform X2 [Limulus polyphemus]
MESQSPAVVPPMPDLSHLSEEERKIIENVMQRQKAEEDKEREVLKKKQDEVKLLESAIQKRKEEHLKLGIELDATCELCLKTKFADGIGHICNYCNVRCCARCGGKVTLRSNKVIWVCILCRKKQELLIKTGTWMHGNLGSQEGSLDQGSGGESTPIKSELTPSSDRRMRLERGHSSEKENILQPTLTHPGGGQSLPSSRRGSLQRTGSSQSRDLKRQFSQETRPSSEYTYKVADKPPSDRGRGGSDKSPSQGESRKRRSIHEDDSRHHREGSDRGRHLHKDGARSREHSPEPPTRQERERGEQDFECERTRERSRERKREVSSERKREERKGSRELRRDELITRDDIRLREISRDQNVERGREDDRIRVREPSVERSRSYDERRPSRERRSFEERRPSRENVNQNYEREPQERLRDHEHRSRRDTSGVRHVHPDDKRDSSYRQKLPNSSEREHYVVKPVVSSIDLESRARPEYIIRRNHLDPSSASVVTIDSRGRSNNNNNRRKIESVVRNDSLSSDQSECVRPPPPKPHKHKRGKKQRQRSLSSSDDEIRSTPEYSSCEEQDIESESVSEKGEHAHFRFRSHCCDLNSALRKSCKLQRDPECYYDSQDIRSPFDSRTHKKTVRFNRESAPCRQHSDEFWDEQQTKDSGIDTSSSATLNEENNRKHPVSWQPSTDGTKMIGHMILKKTLKEGAGSVSSASILGLKVVGGKFFESGRIGAMIEKVKRGSIADTVGHLRPGDEVLEWNGRSLQGKTYEEVYDIIAESRQEPQVELIVCRPLSDVGRVDLRERAIRRLVGAPSETTLDPRMHSSIKDRRPSVTITSPGSPETVRVRPQSLVVGGRIQVKLWYDVTALQLVVTIVSAAGLTPRANQQARNPYVKMFLLPDRSEKSKRRTKTIANASEPKWNQTFVYSPLRRSDLKTRALEITVWDYDRYGANDFLGEVIIDLSSVPLNKEVQWFFLTSHEDSLNSLLRRQNMYLDTEAASTITSTDHLSPPSTLSRLSDSDISEFDLDEGSSLLRDRRLAGVDGASISSLGSSSSPPLVREEFGNIMERRSRRDMSPSGRRQSGTIATRNELVYDQNGRGPVIMTENIPPTLSAIRGRSRSAVHQNESRISRSRSPSRRGSEGTTRSLSPPEIRPHSPVIGPPNLAWRYPFTREGFSSSVNSPKKRQLPAIPPSLRHTSRNQMTLDLEERARQLKLRMQMQRRGGAITPVAMYSDSEVTSRNAVEKQLHVHPHRGRLQPGAMKGSSRHMSPGVGMSPEKETVEMITGIESDGSETSSVSKFSINSAFSIQSERPRGSRTLSEFTTRMQGYGPVHPPRPVRRTLNRSLSSEGGSDEKADGSLSDTAVGTITEKAGMLEQHGAPGKSWGGGKMAQLMGLSKKSSSTSQLSVTEGVGRKHSGSGIQRSQEVFTTPQNPHLARQASRESTDGSLNSISSDSSLWIPSLRLTPDGEYSHFVEGLGPGQLVGRQVLASPSLGDIQLSLCDRKGNLEIEVIRARGLQPRLGAKLLPAPYVKVYLVNGRKCIAKAKTSIARRTLDPLYQQQLVFHEDYRGCVLQVTVWGDYGRMEKKVFMGVSQIMLDDLDLSNIVIGWYKLFHPSSLVNLPASGQRNNLVSMDSFG